MTLPRPKAPACTPEPGPQLLSVAFPELLTTLEEAREKDGRTGIVKALNPNNPDNALDSALRLAGTIAGGGSGQAGVEAGTKTEAVAGAGAVGAAGAAAGANAGTDAGTGAAVAAGGSEMPIGSPWIPTDDALMELRRLDKAPIQGPDGFKEPDGGFDSAHWPEIDTSPLDKAPIRGPDDFKEPDGDISSVRLPKIDTIPLDRMTPEQRAQAEKEAWQRYDDSLTKDPWETFKGSPSNVSYKDRANLPDNVRQAQDREDELRGYPPADDNTRYVVGTNEKGETVCSRIYSPDEIMDVYEKKRREGVHPVERLGKVALHGLQNSLLGLIVRCKNPDALTPKELSELTGCEQALLQLTETIGDAPVYALLHEITGGGFTAALQTGFGLNVIKEGIRHTNHLEENGTFGFEGVWEAMTKEPGKMATEALLSAGFGYGAKWGLTQVTQKVASNIGKGLGDALLEFAKSDAGDLLAGFVGDMATKAAMEGIISGESPDLSAYMNTTNGLIFSVYARDEKLQGEDISREDITATLRGLVTLQKETDMPIGNLAMTLSLYPDLARKVFDCRGTPSAELISEVNAAEQKRRRQEAIVQGLRPNYAHMGGFGF